MKRERPRRLAHKAGLAETDRPYIGSRLRQFGVVVLCTKVVLVPIVFDASLDMPFTVSKALVSYGLTCVLAGVIAGLLVQHGRSAFRWSTLHLPVLAFLAATAASAIFAADRSLALYGTHARMLGLVSTADGVVLYFAIVLLVRTRVDAFAVAISGLGAGSVVLGYEVVQLLGKDPFRWSIDSATRPFSTLGESTALAQYLTSLAVGALACALLIDRVRPSVRALVVVYAGLLFLGSAASGTRSALIGALAGGAMILVFVWLFHRSTPARVASLVATGAAITILGGLLLLTPLGTRIASTIESPQIGDDSDLLERLEPSAAGRVTLYAIGAQMVAERPIFGYGPDNFVVGVPRYRPERAPEHIRQSLATSAHSWAVQVAATSGVVGMMSFAAIALLAFGLALRGSPRRPAALAGAAVLAAFLGTGLTSVNELGTDWLFWASVGVIGAATAPRVTSSTRPLAHGAGQRGAARVSNVQRVALLAIAIVTTVVALSGWNAREASRAARGSQDARLQGQSSQAIDQGLRATRSDGRRAEYWDTLGLAYISAQRWQEASNAFDQAHRLAPYDFRYTGDLVQAQLLLANAGDSGALARAVQFAEEAVRTDPNNPRPNLTRAVAMQASGNLVEALRSVERALALDPGSTNGPLYVTAAQVLLASGRAADSIQVARQGLAVLGRSRSSVALRVELARALVAAGKPADALAELDIALTIQPSDPAAARLRAEIQATVPR